MENVAVVCTDTSDLGQDRPSVRYGIPQGNRIMEWTFRVTVGNNVTDLVFGGSVNAQGLVWGGRWVRTITIVGDMRVAPGKASNLTPNSKTITDPTVFAALIREEFLKVIRFEEACRNAAVNPLPQRSRSTASDRRNECDAELEAGWGYD